MANEAPPTDGDYQALWANKYRGVCIFAACLVMADSIILGHSGGSRPAARAISPALGPHLMGSHVRS
jgi:hypothetical protein